MKTLVRYNPRSLSLASNFDRMMDSFFSDSPVTRSYAPTVDIREDENKYVLEAELPGLTEKDIDVKVEDNLLSISSKTEEKAEEKKNGYILRERRSKSFSRSFVVPKDVDKEKIEAGFKNGLLSLNLHKAPAAKPKSVEIKVG